MGDHRAGALVDLRAGHGSQFPGRSADGQYFEIADDESLDYQAKMEGYRALADAHFDTDRYWEFCHDHLAHLHEAVLEWVDSPEFDKILLDTVRSTYPAHEHEKFLAHFRGFVGPGTRDQRSLTGGPSDTPVREVS